MVDVDQVVQETKLQLKKYKQDIEGAERLEKLLSRAGVPTTEEKIKISEMKDQARMIEKALKKDSTEYPKEP